MIDAEDGGSIRRVMDPDLSAHVYEIVGNNVAKTSMTCPADPTKALGVKLRTLARDRVRGATATAVDRATPPRPCVNPAPAYFVMQVKNLGHYFSFEVEVLDDKGEHRRFRASNFQVRFPPPCWPSRP